MLLGFHQGHPELAGPRQVSCRVAEASDSLETKETYPGQEADFLRNKPRPINNSPGRSAALLPAPLTCDLCRPVSEHSPCLRLRGGPRYGMLLTRHL